MSASLIQMGFRDPGVRWIGAGWTAFILENLILSENRQTIIDALGDDNYHLAYSTLSTLACGSIMYGYLRYGRGKGVPLSPPSTWRNGASFAFRTLGLVGLSQQIPLLRMPYTYEEIGNGSERGVVVDLKAAPAKTWRCPMDFGSHGSNDDEVKGMQRISRHATFWSLGFIGIGAAVRAAYLPEVVMFTFPTVFALIGGAHQDHRFLKNSGGNLSMQKYNATSNIPFWAVLTGHQSFSDICKEIKLPNMGIAVSASLLVALRHLKK